MQFEQKLTENVIQINDKIKNASEPILEFPDLSNYPIVKAFLAGSFSGTFSTILFQPLDLVKTRLQNPTPSSVGRAGSAGMVTIVSHILHNDQLWGLWKGMTPSITRCVPGVGLYFSSLDWLKSTFTNGDPNALEAVTLGIVARSFAGAVLIPITVVKTRFESGVYKYGSMGDAFQSIYKTEGVRGLVCGLGPTLLRDAPFSGLYLMFYTQGKKIIPKDLLNSNYSAPIHFTCGLSAGILASIVTQPADVIKTKMQLYPDKFHNVLSVITYIQTKYGVQGYFKGVVPRMLRRTMMTAMAWTVYEQVTKSIGLK